MRRRRTTSRFFRRFIAAYAVAFSVFVLFGLVVYRAGIRELRRYLIDVEVARFEEQVERFLFQIDLIESIPVIIDAQESTFNLARLERGSIQENIHLIEDYYDYLRTLDFLNVYTSSIAVYFPGPDIYVGDIVTTRANVIYDDVLRVGAWPFDQWRETLTSPGSDDRYFEVELPDQPPGRRTYFMHLRRIPIIRSRGAKLATVVTTISRHEVFSSFTSAYNSPDGFLVFYDSEGNVVSDYPTDIGSTVTMSEVVPLTRSNGDGFDSTERVVAGQDYLMLTGAAPTLGWTILAGIPSNVVTQQIRYIPVLFSIMAGIALLAFLSVAVTFARNNSRLVERVMDILNNRQDDRPVLKVSGFDSLYAMARKVVQDRQTLDEELAVRNVWLQGSTVERLMRGFHDPEEPIEKLLSSVGLTLKGDQFLVAVLRVTSARGACDVAHELAVHPKIVQRSLIERSDVSVLTHEISVDTAGFILGYRSGDFECAKQEIEVAFSFLREFAHESMGRNYLIGVGAPRETLTEIHESCDEALAAIDFSTTQNGFSLAYYDEIVSDEIYTSFPVELEARLSRVINTSSEADAERVFQSIFPDASIRAKWSVAYKEQFKSFVMGIVIKLFSMESVASYDSSVITIGTFRELQEESDLDLFRDRVLSIVKDLIRYKRSLRNVKDEKQIERIAEMIRTHYAEPEFSVSAISDALHITPGYLSSLFKEHEGESISARIESVRLEHAADLLRSTEEHVHDIQDKVGYRNPNTFYKAFKRRFGRSPKEYRYET